MYTEFWKEKLATDSKEVIADLEALLKLTGEDLSERGNMIRERIESRLSKARQQLKESQNVIGEKVAEGAGAANEAIRANVYTSLGLAAAAGVVVGLVLARR